MNKSIAVDDTIACNVGFIFKELLEVSRLALFECFLAYLMELSKMEKNGSTFLINIDGPWGSGKSSLLKIVKNEIQIGSNSSWIII
jgi:hypothetical protein